MSKTIAENLAARHQNANEKWRSPNDVIRSPEADQGVETVSKATIAHLSPDQISQMTCEQLVQLVRDSQLSFLRGGRDQCLDGYDRETLQRLVYVARRCCRNQGY